MLYKEYPHIAEGEHVEEQSTNATFLEKTPTQYLVMEHMLHHASLTGSSGRYGFSFRDLLHASRSNVHNTLQETEDSAHASGW